MSIFDRFLPVSRYHFDRTMEIIMSKLTDFADQLNQHNADMHTAIDGIVSDLDELQRKLDEINNNPGTISPEDQAALDAAMSLTISVRDRLRTVDDMNPPAVPTDPTDPGDVSASARSAGPGAGQQTTVPDTRGQSQPVGAITKESVSQAPKDQKK